ncbi:MAG: serine/threonine protein kinase [Bacteroides sp.]|nr:serine/threonine protein kinase [Bacteroides sp.]
MIEINNKKLCESCFSEMGSGDVCPSCGFRKADHDPDPLVLPMGTRLNEKIIIGRVMGKGGFGITYLGYDLRMDKVIAVKEYYPNGISYRAHAGTELSVVDPKAAEAFEEGAQKFYTEAEMVSQFNGNPNIMGVYDYFRANNTVYLVMEYLSGITLKNYIKKHGRLTDGQALYVMDKIVAAMTITHSAGVLHRDISPDNIMICADGKVKLIDFGAARQILTESSSNLTVVMKPGYTPIEQYTKKGKQGAWTDIYSLGVSVYYALTEVVLDDPYARMDSDPEFDENKHNINSSLWSILKKCTMISAADRYGNAIDLRKALKSVSAPLKAEEISLTEDDLKSAVKNEEDRPTAPADDDIPATVMGSEPDGEEIERFETESALPDIAEQLEESEREQDRQGKGKHAKEKGEEKKKLMPFICAAAGLAAAAAVGIVVLLNTDNTTKPVSNIEDTTASDTSPVSTDAEKTTESAAETSPIYDSDYPEMINGRIYLEMDAEYQGADAGKSISKRNFLRFDGDVKVTLGLEHISENSDFDVIQITDLNHELVEVMAFNNGRWGDQNKWYSVFPDMDTFSFVVSRESVDKMIAALRLPVIGMIVKTAVLEEYDPSEYEPSDDAVTVDINTRAYFKGSGLIPKETLEAFGSDVRVALSIEYENMDPDNENSDIVIAPMSEYYGPVAIEVENNSQMPWMEGGYTLGCRAVSPYFVFTITREEIEKLTDGGLMFNSGNVYIKTAALERSNSAVVIDLSGYYPGDWDFQEKGIAKEELLKLGGDVKVTLELENRYPNTEKFMLIRDGGWIGGRVSVKAINKGPDYDGEGDVDTLWYNFYNEGQDAFTFIITRENIENLQYGLNFGVTQMTVKSAVLEPYDPSEYEAGSGAAVVEINSAAQWSDSPFISKETLQAFGGDVRVIADIEYAEDSSLTEPAALIAVMSYNDGSGEEYCPAISVENNSPWMYYSHITAYYLGSIDCPDKFIFTVPQESIDKLSKAGLCFRGQNLYIKTVSLEKAQ